MRCDLCGNIAHTTTLLYDTAEGPKIKNMCADCRAVYEAAYEYLLTEEEG